MNWPDPPIAPHPRPGGRAASRRRRGGGFVIIYMVIVVTMLLSFFMLVVDWGHVQVAKTEIMNAATAAARAGVIDLVNGKSVATNTAIAYAGMNTVDGTALVLTAGDVTFGTWTPGTGAFVANTASPNAIRVIAMRTAARGTAIPLTFGRAMGVPACDVKCTAIATAARDVQVSIALFYNNQSFVTDGTPFWGGGGVDHGGYTLSATLLGGTVTRGATVYTLGPSAGNNGVSCAGQTIPLPPGDFRSVVLLVAQGYGPVTGALTLNNRDGTTTVVSQSFSDWCAPRAAVLNENVCAAMAYRNLAGGGRNAQACYVLSYEFAITAAAGVASLKLPVQSNLNVLGIGLTPAATLTVK